MPKPQKGDIWEHKRTGQSYFVLRLVRRRLSHNDRAQHPQADKWMDGVLYCQDVDDIDAVQWFERPLPDFLDSFECVVS